MTDVQSDTEILIATVLREQGETGIQTHFNTFRKYLVERGVTVAVVTPFLCPQWAVIPIFGVRKLLDRVSGELSVWWYRYWHYLFLKAALRQQLLKQSQMNASTVIYAQEPLAAKAALEARQSTHQRVMMMVHFNVSQADEWVGKGKISKAGWAFQAIKKLESEILPQLDGIIYTTDFMKRTIEQQIPQVAHVTSVVLPCFISPSVRPTQPKLIGDLITIGTLEPRKNQSYLLQILAEAKQRGKQYSLTFIGNGPDFERLKNLSCQLNIDAQVTFLGFQEQASTFLPNHKIYVHSALFESFGIVLVEAMAYGVPILAGAVGGIPEVFTDGVEGYYWPLTDPVAAAVILINTMEDIDTRNQMAQAAKERFSSQFDSNVVANKLLTFLKSDRSSTETNLNSIEVID